MTAMDGKVYVGHVDITCPDCDTVVPVPVTAEIVNNEYAHLGESRLVCEPDMTDMWAHTWSHHDRP